MIDGSVYQTPFSPIGNSAIAFAPHPDDETLGCGGTLALHALNNDPVTVVFLTNGSKGDFAGRYPNLAEYVQIREEEAKKACAELGVKRVMFLNYQDRELKNKSQQLCAELRQICWLLRPTIAYIPAQTENHPDHRTAQDCFWQILDQTKIHTVMQYETKPPTVINAAVDITHVMDRKTKACEHYISQLEVYDYKTAIEGLNRYRALLFEPSVRYVEGFFITSMRHRS